MKKSIVLICLLYSSFLLAQEPQWLNPKPFGYDMQDIAYFNDSQALMLGAFGKAAVSSDGGLNWEAVETGTQLTLNKIEVIDQNTAIVVADTFLLLTTDKGLTFTVLSQLANRAFYTIDMYSATEGWALVSSESTTQNQLAFTNDGGQTWSYLAFTGIASSIQIADIAFKDASNGLVLAFDGDFDSYVYNTNNAGQSFSLGSFGSEDMSNDLIYTTNNTYYLVGDVKDHKAYKGGRVSKTTDNGETWVDLLDGNGVASGLWFKQVKALNDSVVVAFGSTAYGDALGWTVVSTTDGGTNWTKHVIHPDYYKDSPIIQALGLAPNQHLVAYDSQMRLFSQSSDFKNWYFLDNSFGGKCYGMEFIPDKAFINSNGHIMQSLDGGLNWDTLYRSPDPHAVRIHSLDFATPSLGLALLKRWNDYLPLRTTDGGQTWDELSANDFEPVQSMAFLHPNQAWIYGSNQLHLSTDQGVTWAQKSLPEDSLANLVVAAQDSLVLFGNGLLPSTQGYFVSTDAAQSWEFYSLGIDSINKGFVLNNSFLFVGQNGATNRVYKVDRLNNNFLTEIFAAQPGEQISDFAFTTPAYGYVLVQRIDGAYIFQTSNGGINWISYGPYPYIENLKLTYNLNGFAYGDYGRLLKLADGMPVGLTLNEKSSLISIALNGNPVGSIAEFEILTSGFGNGRITVYDVQAKALIEIPVELKQSKQIVKIDVGMLPIGIYFAEFAYGNSKTACQMLKVGN